MRAPSFVVAVLRSSRIAHDWGIQGEAVRFLERMTRTQLTILLEGRGYFDAREGLVTLGPGDFVEKDQARQEAEGCSGTPCTVIFVEWEDGTMFGPQRHGVPRFGHLNDADQHRLRGLISQIEALPPVEFVGELAAILFAAGHLIALDAPPTPAPSAQAARTFALLGDAISQLSKQPSLTEMADALALTERQANRHVKALTTDYAHPNTSFREFMHDVRIGVATQLLAVPGVSLAEVAHHSGYGSVTSLSHAFALRGASSPGRIATRLRRRWQ